DARQSWLSGRARSYRHVPVLLAADVRRFQTGQLLIREPDRARGHVLDEVVRVAGARDGQHVRSLVQGPGELDLRASGVVRVGDRAQLFGLRAGLALLAPG